MTSTGISVSTFATWVATMSGVGWVWFGILHELKISAINRAMKKIFFMLASFTIGIGYHYLLYLIALLNQNLPLNVSFLLDCCFNLIGILNYQFGVSLKM